MMALWVNKIAHDLWEFNGKVGDSTDYLYLAWSGIFTGDTQDDPCMQLFITIDDFNNYQNNYIDHVVGNSETIDKENQLNNCINN